MSTILQFTEKLVDQEARDRFAEGIDTNFSVIAPAGVGKTTAIVQRIVRIAASCDYRVLPSELSKLVVVTYTQKAADEMRNRAHQGLLKDGASAHCLQEFNKAFFGTIHSFCLKLIQSYGPQIGVPSNAALLVNDEDLWHEFLNLNGDFSNLIPGAIKVDLCKYINLSKLVQLARRVSPGSLSEITLGHCPNVDLTAVFNHTSTRSAKKVIEIQKELKRWWAQYQEDPFALDIPEVNQGDSEFKELCARAFSPLWHWLGDAAQLFVMGLAREYQRFRISKGLITYDDMVGLAARLVRDPYVIRVLHALDYHVILDEAQDTDAQQFAVLLGVVPVDGSGASLGGRFSMLGDPQQAIYSSRADLPTYLKVHNDLLLSNAAETLTFNVTMRCDRAIVAHCNAVFPSILKNKAGVSQIDFVPLSARPWAGDGYVGKFVLDMPEESDAKLNTSDLEKYEARLLADKIRDLGLAGLGISDWSELALLTPRKSWLVPIAEALQAVGIPAQIHSRNDIKGDNPAFAWLCALLVIMIRPNDSFEIAGVLREVFGLSDDEIANYVRWWDCDKSGRHPLNISFIDNGQANDSVAEALRFLYELRKEILKCSLSEALHQVVDRVELRRRLLSLPGYDSKNLIDSLDQILIQATLLEEQGSSLAEFVASLGKDYYGSDEPVLELKGHVQCFTSHKAKGLEWSVVIVPFLFRGILFPPQEYPQLISVGSDYASKIAVCNHPDKKEYDALVEQYRIAELERLLYVTATRARGRLIWVDDEALFKNAPISFASLLNITAGRENRQIWNLLSTTLPIPSEFASSATTYEQNALFERTPEHSGHFDPNSMAVARKHSKVLLQRLVPSQLKKDLKCSGLIKSHLQSENDYSPIDYGNWWHAMMETLPWGVPAEWRSHLSQYLPKCPEPLRGEREFELFLNSESLKALFQYDLQIKTELPFLYQAGGDKCFEGFIDFFGFCEQTQSAIIIDWKTDLFDPRSGGLDVLREMYSLQLAVYREAVEKSCKTKVQTFLFSTCVGELCEC